MPQLKSIEKPTNVKPFVAKAVLPPVASREQALDQMVDSFTAMSQQLSQSYSFLEHRVSELTDQLQEVNLQVDKAQQDKQVLNDRFASLLEILPGGVVIIDNHGVVIECNPVAIRFLGEPLCGERWTDIIQRNFAPRNDDGCEISLKDGRRVSLATSSLPDGNGQIILLTDQTETRRLQGMLSRHQRLSAMGKMMSSLAHQIRTPLSSAMLYAEHLSNEALSPAMTRRFAGKVLARLHNLEAQVRDMLVFARGEVEISDVLSGQQLADVWLEQALDIAREQGVTLSLTCDEPLEDALVACNKDILLGAMANLVNNACQALHDAKCDTKCVILSMHVDHDSLYLWVRDNGPGFSKEALLGIQEAFFTTKSTGTGLGLSVVRAVAAAHHGRFLIEKPASGAKVGIKLPLIHTKEAQHGE
ncbi:MAG TPA: ATP-binding protein [Pseudomonadales bacterium]|nr:ATP-binding protein [Pseudomonadales bacterium]